MRLQPFRRPTDFEMGFGGHPGLNNTPRGFLRQEMASCAILPSQILLPKAPEWTFNHLARSEPKWEPSFHLGAFRQRLLSQIRNVERAARDLAGAGHDVTQSPIWVSWMNLVPELYMSADAELLLAKPWHPLFQRQHFFQRAMRERCRSEG